MKIHRLFCMNLPRFTFGISRALCEGREHVAHLLGDSLALLLVASSMSCASRVEHAVEPKHVRVLHGVRTKMTKLNNANINLASYLEHAVKVSSRVLPAKVRTKVRFMLLEVRPVRGKVRAKVR